MSNIQCYLPLSDWLPFWPLGLFDQPNLDEIAIVQYSGSSTSGVVTYQMTLAYTSEIAIGLPGVSGLSLVVLNSGGWTELQAEADLGSGVDLRLLDLSLALRVDSTLLQPVSGSPELGWTPVEDSSGQPAPLELVFTVGTLTVDVEGKLFLEGASALTLPPVMIGSTGLVVEADGVALYLSGSEIPPVGQNAGFRGIALDAVTVYLPSQLQIPGLLPGSILAENVSVGSGGLSGTFSGAWSPSWSGNAVSGDGAGTMGGFAFGLESLSIQIVQNTLTEGVFSGFLSIPFFDQPVHVALSLGLDGSLSVALDQASGEGLIELTIPDVAILKLSSLGLESDDAGLSILLSGSIQLLVGSPALDWPAIAIQNLRIQADGKIVLPGGWLDFQEPLALNLYGFQVEISQAGFGSLEDGRRWIGFSGGLHLIALLPSGVSVEGLRITWNPSGPPEVQISLDGVGLELTVPDVFSLTGSVSMTEEGTAHVFNGSASLELLPLGIKLDVSLKIGHDDLKDYTFFYAFMDLELPVGIPIWATGAAIYGISGLNGINVLPSATNDDWYGWYASSPKFNVSDGLKWVGNPDGQAFGAGMSLGTLFDAGFAVSTKALFALILPGPVILFNGKANVLQLPPELSDSASEGVFDLLAILDARQGFLQLNIDAGWQLAQVMDISAAAEAYFSFTNPGLWHVYLGQDQPEEKRIRASALALFHADAYLMLDNQGIAAGFGVNWGDDWKFGPVKAVLKSWVEAGADISWQPAQLEGSLSLGGAFEISVAGFGAGLAVEATLSGKAPTLYWVKGTLKLTVKLPVPLKDLEEKIQLEWKEEAEPPLAPPGVTFGLEHFKVDETWQPARPDPALPPSDGNYAPGPLIPLDARPSIVFDRSMKDESTDVELTSVNVYAGPVSIGDYQFDYKVKSVRLEKWAKAGGTVWSPVEDLYGTWLAVEDASGEPAASKLQLWTNSPFEFTRQTSRLYRDTFLANHLAWPCVDAPPLEIICVSWEDQSPDTGFSPVFNRGGLLFSLEHASQTIELHSEECHTERALWLENGDTLWVVFPEPVRNIAVCLARGAFLSGQAYAGGVQVAQNLVVNGTVVFQAEGMDTLRLNKALNVYLAGICYMTEALAGQIESVQEHMDSLSAGSAHWSSAEQIFEPETWYRLTLELETVRSQHGDETSDSYACYASFQTAGAPGLVPTSAAEDAPSSGSSSATALAEAPYPDGGQLVSLAPYVQWAIPADGALAVFRSYDLGVDFNETYVEQMYGADMQIRLRDRNGQPVLDATGQEVLFANLWGQAPTAELTETEMPYLTRIEDCLDLPPVFLPSNQKILFTNGVLFEDDFASGLDNWSDPDAAGNDPNLNWVITGGVLQWTGASFPVLGALLVAGDPAWGDYALEVELTDAGEQIGLVFRYTPGETESYYRLILDGSGRKLERVAGQLPSLLWQDATAYSPGQVGVIGVQCTGSRIRGQADGSLLFDLQDEGGLLAGQVGVYANSAAGFAHFLARVWPGEVLGAQAQYSAELIASFVLFQGGLFNGWTDSQAAWQEWAKTNSHIAVLGREVWDDYRLEVNVSNVSRQAGLIVRFHQPDAASFSCYRLLLNPDEGSLRLARLDGTLSGSTFTLVDEGKSEIWSCRGDSCGIDFSLLEHTLALTCAGDSLIVEMDGLELTCQEVENALPTGRMGLFYNSGAAPLFSDLVVRSAPRQPVLHWSFITSRYAGLVELMDTFTGSVYPEAITGVNLRSFRTTASAAAASLGAAQSALEAARLALSAATAETLPSLREAAQQAAIGLTVAASGQFEALYAFFFPAVFRPAPPVLEISELNQKKLRLALLLESPEPLDWTRLTAVLSKLNPATGKYKEQSDIKIVWNEDGTRALLVSAAGGSILPGSYRLHFAYNLDLGAEAPLLRRAGSSLPEVAALEFTLL